MAQKEVLIVEDEPMIARLVTIVVERAGYTADWARNGTEALSRMKERTYPAVILDLMIPAISGYELLDHVKETSCTECVIVLTAADDHDLDRLDHSALRKVFRKPFDVKELEEEIRSIGSTLPEAVVEAESPRIEIAADEDEGDAGTTRIPELDDRGLVPDEAKDQPEN